MYHLLNPIRSPFSLVSSVIKKLLNRKFGHHYGIEFIRYTDTQDGHKNLIFTQPSMLLYVVAMAAQETNMATTARDTECCSSLVAHVLMPRNKASLMIPLR